MNDSPSGSLIYLLNCPVWLVLVVIGAQCAFGYAIGRIRDWLNGRR
jgi:hypothetical protein